MSLKVWGKCACWLLIVLALSITMLTFTIEADENIQTSNADRSYDKLASTMRTYIVMSFDISAHSPSDSIANANLSLYVSAIAGTWNDVGYVNISMVPYDKWRETSTTTLTNESYYNRTNETSYTGPSGTGAIHFNVTNQVKEAISLGLSNVTLIISTNKSVYMDINHQFTAATDPEVYLAISDYSEYLEISTRDHGTPAQRPSLNVTYTPASDSISPKWYSNKTNSTMSDTHIRHDLYVTDETALSEYVFEFDNGTGTFTNLTHASLTGTTDEINYTVHVNSTEGSTIRWRVYVNDTSGNMNITDIFMYATTNNFQIDNCVIINDSGTYTLTNSIIDATAVQCIKVYANDVTIDCQGYTIDGTDGGFGYYAIETNSSNTTIQYCNFSDWYAGPFFNYSLYGTVQHSTCDSMDDASAYCVSMDYGNHTTILNVSVINSYGGFINDESWNLRIINSTVDVTNLGIFLDMDPDHSIIQGNKITSADDGITCQYMDNGTLKDNKVNATDKALTLLHAGDCSNSWGVQDCTGWDERDLIYNNLFNGSILLVSVSANKWNVTEQTGINIHNASNPNIGGNYYTNAAGSGSSDTCADADNDGFCDSSVTHAANNIDYLALSDEYLPSDSTSPTITIVNPTNTTYNTLPIDINVTVNENADWCGYNLGGNNITLSNSSMTNWYGQNNSLISPTTYNIKVYCNDTSGNIGENLTVWFTYQALTYPVITIFSPSNTTYYSSIHGSTLDMNWSNDSELDWIAFSINGEENESFSENITRFSFDGTYEGFTFNSPSFASKSLETSWYTYGNESLYMVANSDEMRGYKVINFSNYDKLRIDLNITYVGVPGPNYDIDICNNSLGYGTDNNDCENDLYSLQTTGVHNIEIDISNTEGEQEFAIWANLLTKVYVDNIEFIESLNNNVNKTILPEEGSNNVIIWANDTSGNMNFTRVYFTYHNLGTVDGYENITSYPNYTFSGAGYHEEFFNVTVSSSGATYFANLSTGVTNGTAGQLGLDTTNFTVTFAQDEIHILNNQTNILINITSNNVLLNDTYHGNLTFTSQDGQVRNVSITAYFSTGGSGNIVIYSPTTLQISGTSGSSSNYLVILNNSGNYQLTNCNISLVSSFGTSSYNVSDFTLAVGEILHTNIEFYSNTAGSDASAHVEVTCKSDIKGGFDLDTISALIAISESSGGGSTGGGGSPQPAVQEVLPPLEEQPGLVAENWFFLNNVAGPFTPFHLSLLAFFAIIPSYRRLKKQKLKQNDIILMALIIIVFLIVVLTTAPDVLQAAQLERFSSAEFFTDAQSTTFPNS